MLISKHFSFSPFNTPAVIAIMGMLNVSGFNLICSVAVEFHNVIDVS